MESLSLAVNRRMLCRVVLAFFMMVAWLLPPVARAQYYTTMINGTVTLERYLGSDIAVTIPTNYYGEPVTGIGVDAFADCTNLQSVFIPDTITNIGQNAFSECTSLTNVVIPDSVISLGDSVFFACSNLTTVAIGDGVTNLGGNTFVFCCSLANVSLTNGLKTIGEGDFLQCYSLASITIPKNVTSIGTNAFVNCTSLPSINIPNNVTNIEDGAFAGCTSLTNVTISNPVTSIGAEAFAICTNLTDLSFLDQVTTIGDEAFISCIGLTNVIIPDNVTNIGKGPFADCENLAAISVDPRNPSYSSAGGVLFDKNQNILVQFPIGELTPDYTIPDTATTIEYESFLGCYNQTNISIPNSVTNIEDYSFEYDLSVTSLTADPQNPAYSSVDGVLFNKNRTTLIQFPTGKPITSYNLPSPVISIEDGAFQGCNLTSLDITNNINSIGNYVFCDCTSLTNITLPDTVINIGTNAFLGCSSLGQIIIPVSIASIGADAFDYCTNLTIVYFQGNAPTIKSEVIDNMNYIPEVFYFDPATAYYLPGTTGWNSFATNSGLPTVELSTPQIGHRSASVQANGNGFGFTIIGYPTQTMTVEASTNLVNWQPLQTITFTGTITNFVDAQWKNYPARFYRVQ